MLAGMLAHPRLKWTSHSGGISPIGQERTSTFFPLGSSYPALKLNCGWQLTRKKARVLWSVACKLWLLLDEDVPVFSSFEGFDEGQKAGALNPGGER